MTSYYDPQLGPPSMDGDARPPQQAPRWRWGWADIGEAARHLWNPWLGRGTRDANNPPPAPAADNAAAPAPARRRNDREQAWRGRGQADGLNGAFAQSLLGPGRQAEALGGMIDKTTSAWGKEHDRRVDMAREERQRQHELQLASMRPQREAPQYEEAPAAPRPPRRNPLVSTFHIDGQGNQFLNGDLLRGSLLS